MDKDEIKKQLFKAITKVEDGQRHHEAGYKDMAYDDVLGALTVVLELLNKAMDSEPDEPEEIVIEVEITGELAEYIKGKDEEIARLSRLNERFLHSASYWMGEYKKLRKESKKHGE